jgi:hypothetical protein
LPACSRCLIEVTPGTALCPSCGAAIRRPVVARPTPKRPGKSRQRVDAVNHKDRIVGPASLVLLISFWLPWYTVGPLSASGVGVHGWLFIAVINAVILVLYVLITAFGVGDLAGAGRLSKDELLAVLTGVNLALVLLGFLWKPAGLSWGWGGVLAVIAAIVAFVPYGVPVVRERLQR